MSSQFCAYALQLLRVSAVVKFFTFEPRLNVVLCCCCCSYCRCCCHCCRTVLQVLLCFHFPAQFSHRHNPPYTWCHQLVRCSDGTLSGVGVFGGCFGGLWNFPGPQACLAVCERGVVVHAVLHLSETNKSSPSHPAHNHQGLCDW